MADALSPHENTIMICPNGLFASNVSNVSTGRILTLDLPDCSLSGSVGQVSVCDKTADALAAVGRDDLLISGSTYFYDGGGCC